MARNGIELSTPQSSRSKLERRKDGLASLRVPRRPNIEDHENAAHREPERRLGEVLAWTGPIYMRQPGLRGAYTERLGRTYLLPKPNTTLRGSWLMLFSMSALFPYRSGLNVHGSGYMTSSCTMFLEDVRGQWRGESSGWATEAHQMFATTVVFLGMVYP